MARWTQYNPTANTLTEGVSDPFDTESDWKGCSFYCWEDDLTFFSPYEPGCIGYALPLITTREDGVSKLNRTLILKHHDDSDYDDE